MKLLWPAAKWLIPEINSWVNKRLIKTEQKDAILRHYGLDGTSLHKRRLWASQVVQAVALLFIAASAVLLATYVWAGLAAPARFAMAAVPMLLTFFAGFYYYKRGGSQKGKILLSAASLLLGGAIWLIAEILQFPLSPAYTVLFWLLGMLPIALYLRSYVLLLLCAVLTIAFMSLEASAGQVSYWGGILSLSFISYCYINKNKPIFLFTLSIISFFVWLDFVFTFQFAILPRHLWITLVYTASFAVLLGDFNERILHHEKFGQLLKLWGARLVLMALLLFSFKDFSKWVFFLGNATHNKASELLSFRRLAITGLAMFGAQVFLFISSVRVSRHRFQNALLLLLSLVLFLISFLRVSLPQLDPAKFHTIIFVVFNGMCLYAAVYFVNAGIHQDKGLYFYSGIVFIILLAACRYYDLIGGPAGGAVTFFFAALVLYGTNYYWKRKHGTQ